MGSARFSPTDWDSFTAAKTAGRSTAGVFCAKHIDPSLDPSGVTLRESRDSAANPDSTAIIIGLDVTGSMGILADSMARTGLATLFTEIYNRRPVPDPHILFAGIGDIRCDTAPLQVSQFEADIRLAEQLVKLWLEHGGGGNDSESYDAVWWFAAAKTAIDCWEKRGKKGYLFTVGDESTPYGIQAVDMLRHGWIQDAGDVPSLFTPQALLQAASARYHVFHVVVEEGNYARAKGAEAVAADWRKLLGQNVLSLDDHTKLAEVVVSAIQVVEGFDSGAVSASWSGSTAATVYRAVSSIKEVSKAPRATPSTASVVPF